VTVGNVTGLKPRLARVGDMRLTGRVKLPRTQWTVGQPPLGSLHVVTGTPKDVAPEASCARIAHPVVAGSQLSHDDGRSERSRCCSMAWNRAGPDITRPSYAFAGREQDFAA